MTDSIETKEPGSPGWWFLRLLKRLGDQRDRCERLDAYYCGTAPVPLNTTKECRDAYRRLMRLARTNFAELIVESVRERMEPVGFRTGADSDELGDSEAWRIWQSNQLDADSVLLFRAMLSLGVGYMIVGPVDEDLGVPLITPEDPREVVTEQDPRRRRRTRAGLKVYYDDVLGADVSYLYLPGVVYQAMRQRGPKVHANYRSAAGWEWQDDGEELGLGKPVVSVVRFANREDLYGNAAAEFEPYLSHLDRIGYGVLNRLEIVTLQAFRQRALKGDLPSTDPLTGEEIDYNDLFSSDPGSLWRLPDGVDLWESGQVDLTPIHTAIRDDVLDLAAVSGLPIFYLTPDAANGSAEGAALAKERLIFRCRDRLRPTGEQLEQVMSLAFLFAGDQQRARRPDMEVLWAPPERLSMAERYDAASKAGPAGVPWRTVMRTVLGFSPQEIDRMEAERATDELVAGGMVGADSPETPRGRKLASAELLQKIYLAVGKVLTSDEARAIVNSEAGQDLLPVPGPEFPAASGGFGG